MEKEFNVDDIDYKKSLEEIKNKVKKPNIMVCGATGAGKSSLTNDIFGEVVANVGSGRPQTRGVKLYTSDNSTVNLFDTEGYEVGAERWEYYKENIIGYITEQQIANPKDVEKHIHEVWYCVNAANHRLLDADISTINEIINMKIPLAIVITQIDVVSEEELESLIEGIRSNFNNVPYFTYCVSNDDEVLEAVRDYIQKKELLRWAEEHLSEGLQEGLVCAVNGNIDDKRLLVKKKIIPKYAVAAAAAVVTPIPCADSVVLIPIQVTMTMHIMRTYGIDKISGAVSSLVSSTIISTLGRTIAGGLLKLIPVVGTVFGTLVNGTVATSITLALGYAISELSYRYSKAKAEGKNVLPEDYINSDTLKEMFDTFLSQVKSEDK